MTNLQQLKEEAKKEFKKLLNEPLSDDFYVAFLDEKMNEAYLQGINEMVDSSKEIINGMFTKKL